MNLEQFGEELKQIRLNNKLSLMDISAETRISLKFLDAIERGQFQILPQTYIRAFLREYALMNGIDPNDVMQRYESARQESSSQGSNNILQKQIPLQEKKQIENNRKKQFSLSPLQRNITIGIFLFAVIVLIAILSKYE